MKNCNQIQTIMGMSIETYKRLNREYACLNPHKLPGVRPKRRRIVRCEVAFSTATNDITGNNN